MSCKRSRKISAYTAFITSCCHFSFQYYTNVETGKKFYSKKEVTRYMNAKDTCHDVTQVLNQDKSSSQNNVSQMNHQDKSFSENNVSQMNYQDRSCSENNVSQVSFEGEVTTTFYFFVRGLSSEICHLLLSDC